MRSTTDERPPRLVVFLLAFSARNPRLPDLTAGGDIRLVQLLNHAHLEKGTQVTLISSNAGTAALSDAVAIPLRLVSTGGKDRGRHSSRIAITLGQLGRGFYSLVWLFRTRTQGRNVIYSSSNLLPDVTAAFLGKLLIRETRWAAMVHHVPTPEIKTSESVAISIVGRVSAAVASLLISMGADRIFVLNDSARNTFLRLGVPSSRILRTSNGVDLELFSRYCLPLTDRLGQRVICIGRLGRQKGSDSMVRMWRRVIDAIPSAHLDLVGSEDTLTVDELRGEAAARGLSSSVSIWGAVSRESLLTLLSTARVAVFPSFVEGWGIALMESLACGTPAVAWDLPAYSFASDAAVRVPVADEEQFARSIATLLQSDIAWHERSGRGLKAATQYSWDQVLGPDWAAIKTLLGETDEGPNP